MGLRPLSYTTKTAPDLAGDAAENPCFQNSPIIQKERCAANA